jgi:glycosyltransferase involved in cell wall biosynthesis
LFIPGSPKDLSEKILYLLDSEALCDRLGKTGKILSENYSWKTITYQTEKIYLDLICNVH